MASCSLLVMNASLEISIRILAVLVSAVGAAVAVPDATRRIGRNAKSAALRVKAALGGRSKGGTNSGSLAASVAKIDSALIGWSWSPDGTVEKRFEQVLERIEQVESEARKKIEKVNARLDAVDVQVGALSGAQSELKAARDRDRDRAEQIDANGLVLIVAGIAISSFPEWLASLPACLGLLPPILAFVYAWWAWGRSRPAIGGE